MTYIDIESTLNAQIPSIQAVQSYYFDIKENKVSADKLLEQLKGLSLADTLDRLKLALTELVILPIDEEKRLELAEAIYPTCKRLWQKLRQAYVNENHLLKDSQLKIGFLAQSVFANIFNVYRAVILRCSSGRVKPQNKFKAALTKGAADKTQIQAIWRSLQILVNLMLEIKLLQLPIYHGIWSHLNGLYRLAIQRDYQDYSFIDHTNSDIPSTIRQQYLRAILLDLSQSNQLKRQDIQIIADNTLAWSHLVNLSTKQAIDSDNAPHYFKIDLSSSESPLSTRFIQHPPMVDGFFVYVDVRPLLQAIKQDQDHVQFKYSTAKLGRPHSYELPIKPLQTHYLKQHMIDCLSDYRQRQYVRHPSAGKMNCVDNMMSIHYHIANERMFREVIAADELLYKFQLDSMSESQVVANYTKVSRSQLKPYPAVTNDVSPTGFQLTITDPPKSLQVGVLLGLQRIDMKNNNAPAEPWRIGIVRWLRQIEENKINLGVEVISSKASACGVRLRTQDDRPAHYMPALLLSESKAVGQPPSIITPNFNFKANDLIKVRVGKKEVTAKFNKLLLMTGGFCQFEFELM